MADFRKYVLAFAGIACTLGVTGTAYGQSSTTCVASVANPFDERAEGVTEQAGDITLACTGGTPTAAGAVIPGVNISIAGNTAITSRLLNTTTQQSEALLLVDEPNTAISGFGLSICPVPTSTTSVTGCVMTGTGLGGGSTSPTYNPAGGPGTTARYNGFQGTQVGTNIITFLGVPFDPPAAGTTLFLRITNVRMNVSALGAPAAGVFSTVQSLLSISASAGFSVNNPTQVVGNVRRGLVVGAITVAGSTSTTLTPLQQCTGTSTSTFPSVEQINFSEGFASAFKLRLPPGGTPALSIPGNFQNSESQFIPPQNTAIGQADFATRIKITFNNLQTGVSIFVPVTVNSAQLFSAGVPTSTLTLTSTEAGGFSAVGASSTSGVPTNFAQLTVTSGSAIAVYEVSSQLSVVGVAGSPAVNQSTSTVESFAVPVAISFTASPGTNSPGLGSSTVNVDFAPTTGSLTTAQAFGVTGGTIPRFVPTSTASTGFTINACSTVLLFPFMSNLAGFDTGIALSSTSTDPFGTAAQSGSCTMNFFGSNAPANFVTPIVASGTSYTNLLSTVAPGFQGYMIAQCRFQYAHGFAFITDGFGGPGRGLSQGYLALVLPDPNATGGRKANPPGAQTVAGSGESVSQ